MVKSLLNSLLGKGKSRRSDELPKPDLSRVINIQDSELAAHNSVAKPPLPQPDMADPNEMADRAAAAVDDMSKEFEEWLNTDLTVLKSSWSELQAKPDDELVSRAFFLAAHNLRGGANTYGYPAISRLCASLCKLLEAGNLPSNMALINLHVEACWAARNMGDDAAAADAMAQSVCSALEAQVAKKIAVAGDEWMV